MDQQRGVRRGEPPFNTRAPMIYVHGVRGTGKLTVARALLRWLDDLGITARICEHSYHIENDFRDMVHQPYYSELIAAQRQRLLRSMSTSEELRNVVMICTDAQTTAPVDTSSVCWEYVEAAVWSGRLFYPVYMVCSQATQIRRGSAPERPDYKTKDPDMLEWYARAPIYRFPIGMAPLDLTTEELPPQVLASSIAHFVMETGGFTWWIGQPQALPAQGTLAAQNGRGTQIPQTAEAGPGFPSAPTGATNGSF